ncbi:UNVERIFIED_CONTAM: hypothetical protein GTU68_012542 [Idotea baltica]|nr:hypothetical protein [Idotea baltica]
MFSGKTEELIRRLKRAMIANQRTMIFKPAIDTRYHDTKVVSHQGTEISSQPVSSSQQILLLADGIEVIGIDEAQFFDPGITKVVRTLARNGARVVIAGLDMDFEGNPFGPIPQLLAEAEFVTKVHAICQKCGALANYSFRLSDSKNQVLLGEKDAYEPRCRNCYNEDKA